MVRYTVKIRKVTKLDDKVIRNLRETIKLGGKHGENGEAGGPSP